MTAAIVALASFWPLTVKCSWREAAAAAGEERPVTAASARPPARGPSLERMDIFAQEAFHWNEAQSSNLK